MAKQDTVLVHIHLKEQSNPVIIDHVRNAYTKGPLYCVMQHTGQTRKFPIADIFDIVEFDAEAAQKFKVSITPEHEKRSDQ